MVPPFIMTSRHSVLRKLASKVSLGALVSHIVLSSVVAVLPVFTVTVSADSNLTAATGGTNIDARTAGSTWTTLSGPVLTSIDSNDIPSSGTIVLTIPSTFEFDTTSPPVVTVTCTGAGCAGTPADNINDVSSGTAVAVTMTATTITFTLTDDVDDSTNSLTWSGIRIRPVSVGAVSTQLTKSGVTIDGESATNWGTISSILPTCDGSNGTIFVTDANVIYGGPMDGLAYNGILLGTSGADTIIGTSGNDYVDGFGGNDNICGDLGNDTLNGGDGDDDIFGGDGTDSITGGIGDDDLDGDANGDIIYGGGGSDDCSGGTGTDSIGGCGSEDENNEVGMITVTKDAVPNDAQDFAFTGSWSFTLDDDSDLNLPNTWTTAASDASTRTITESVVSGWTLSDLVCTGAGVDSSVNTGTRTATINIDSDEEVSCTFTNEVTPGTLTVTKVVVNDNGGTKVVGDFTIQVDGSPVVSGAANSFTPGLHTVSEIADVGYAATFSGDCSATGSILLNSGDNKSCTITNDDIAPTLTVTKIVVNDNGGTKGTGDFTIQLDGGSVLSGAPNVTTIGAHSVSEIADPTYTGTIGGDCTATGSITLALGDVKTCTITNNDVQPQLTVVTNVVTDNGGTAVPADFTMSVTLNSVLVSSFAGADGAGVVVPVNAGSFSTSVTVPAPLVGKYSLSFSGDCVGTLVPGDVKTCTYTLNDIAPKLTVTKVVVNDNGGTLVDTTVPLFLDGSPVVTGAQNTTTVGAHTVSETNASGYTSIITGDCASDGTITLGLGEEKTCIFTNNDLPAQLTVIKEVVNDNGGTLTASGFTMTVSGNNPSSTSFAGGTGTVISIDAGSYSVDEVLNTAYSKSLSADCAGVLLPGESKTCTITNDDIAPKLTVTKIVLNTHGGTKNVSDFPLFVDGSPVTSAVQTTLASAGTYVVTETSNAGYTATFSGDCDAGGSVTLAVGEEKFCTLTNTDDVPPVLIVEKIVINDNGGTKTIIDFELSIFIDSFLVSLGIPTSHPAGTHIISEIPDSGYTTSFSGDCAADGSITLLPGDTKICTVINNDVEPVVSSPDTDQGDISNSHRGSDTNRVLGSLPAISSNHGFDGTTPPAGFGGTNNVPLSDAEINFLCSVQRSMNENASDAAISVIAAAVAQLMGRDADFVEAQLSNDALCADVNALLRPQTVVLEVKPRPVVLAEDGYPVSSNDTWNKCVRGTVTLEDIKNNEDAFITRSGVKIPKDCGWYKFTGTNTWKYPEDPFLALTINVSAKGYKFAPGVSANNGYVVVKPSSAVVAK